MSRYKSDEIKTLRDLEVDLETYKHLKILSIENDTKIQHMASQILIKHFARKRKKEEQIAASEEEKEE